MSAVTVPFGQRTGSLNAGAIKFAIISGGAAGNHTVTGIGTSNKILAVIQAVGGSAGTPDITELDLLTDEFAITAANTINNTGGTATADDQLVVIWT